MCLEYVGTLITRTYLWMREEICDYVHLRAQIVLEITGLIKEHTFMYYLASSNGSGFSRAGGTSWADMLDAPNTVRPLWTGSRQFACLSQKAIQRLRPQKKW